MKISSSMHARLLTASLFAHAKEKASEASAKYGDEVGFASEASNNSSSLPFCAGVQFSRDSVLVFKRSNKIRKIEGCDQSRFTYLSLAKQEL